MNETDLINRSKQHCEKGAHAEKTPYFRVYLGGKTSILKQLSRDKEEKYALNQLTTQMIKIK